MIAAAADTVHQTATADEWVTLATMLALICLAITIAGAGAWLLDRWYAHLDRRRAPQPLHRDHPAVMPWPLEHGLPPERDEVGHR